MNGHRDRPRFSILTNFALPAAVAVRIAENGDSHDQEALAANTTLAVEAAVIIGETSRNHQTVQSLLHNVPVPEVLNAVLSQRRETRKTVLRNIIRNWNMDEATQQQFVNRRLPADIADEYLRNRCWFPKPAATAVQRASGPVAVEYLAELAATDLDDDTLAEAAATVIENTKTLTLEQQTTAARWLAEACWLRPVVKTVALNSYAATAIVALTQIGLTADETATVVSKTANIGKLGLKNQAVTQLLMNPTVATKTRQLIAEQFPGGAGDAAAAAGAHRADTTITDGRQLRNVDELTVIDKAVAGTNTFTHLADLIEHPATTRDPHILRRLITLSETPTEPAGPVLRKLLTHIIKLRDNDELLELFKKTTNARAYMQSQAADSNAGRNTAAQKGTHPRHGTTQHEHDSWRENNQPTGDIIHRPISHVTQWQPFTVNVQCHPWHVGQYWRDQLGEGISDESATAWQTALDMADAAPEQSSADIVQLAKTLSRNK